MKKRGNIIIIVVLVVMVIAIVGVSYAAFNYSRTGSINTITTGAITMTYKETDNTISLTGALPTTDKTGMVRLNPGEYFDFSISSEITGVTNINYEISAKDITVLSGDQKKIDGKYIKLYLTKLNGDSEEGLMAPETYNEETSENTYTGRPSGEMSLYTSSMNSSESNNYRLRMYVDEEYNPQGDGGGLTFTAQINVYGKAGDKYVPLTTQKILEDNELQEDTTNMFNYASNGNYTNFDGDDLYDSNYITNGLYEAKDEDGVSYYFRGAVTNNNVQFGEYASDYYVYQGNYNSYYQSEVSCKEAGNSTCTPVLLASRGDKMYWKIVRVNGDGSLRLIYNGTSTNPNNNDLASSFAVGVTPYNLEFLDPKYTGYTYDNGTDSIAKKEVDSWYDNTLGKSSYDKMITNGRFCSDSSGYNDGEVGVNDYDTVFAGAIRLSQAWNDFEEVNNAPTLIRPVTSESYGGFYRLKAGLITADELVLAGESMGVVGNSYLSIGGSNMYYWSMTPAGSTSGCYDIFVYGEMLNVRETVSRFAIRPVINVKADNGFTSGDGSTENPYAIE